MIWVVVVGMIVGVRVIVGVITIDTRLCWMECTSQLLRCAMLLVCCLFCSVDRI